MARRKINNEERMSGFISVLGLAAIFIGLVLTILLPAIRVAGWAIIALGVIILITAFVMDYRRVGRALTGKRGIFSTGSTVMVSIFVGIILLINAISISSYVRTDVTGLNQFTLTSQTKDVLANMDQEVHVIGFFVPGDPYQIGVDIGEYARSLLNEYKNYSTKLSIEEIDPDEHPDQAREYGITQYQSLVFESGDRQRVVGPQEILQQAEHAFTSAILEVTGIVQKKVYFMTGHGESLPSGEYSAADQSLQDNLYKTEVLDLQLLGEIPDDATAIIIAGPKKGLTTAEINILSDYLDNNGWVMFLLNPNSPPEYAQLLSQWGVDVKQGTIIDLTSFVSPSPSSPLIPRIRNMLGFSETYFPEATAIIPREDAPKSLVIQPLFFSSPDSWLEENFSPGQGPKMDEGVDTPGPLAIGVLIAGVKDAAKAPTASDTQNLTRIVVIGDSDFASNTNFLNGDNGNLFLNAVELLTAGKELISIERKVLPFRRLVVTQDVANFINFSSIALLPILVLIGGAFVYWRRR